MAYGTTFNGVNLYLPGAYTKTTVELNPGTSTSSVGIVGIVGEADGGAPGSTDGVQSFSMDEVSSIVSKYRSGPIVDAVRNLVAPAKDPDIPGGAAVVKIYKTNASTQSTAMAENQDDNSASDMFVVDSANYGSTENQISFYVSEGSIPDQQPHLISSALTFPLTVTGSATMSLIVGSTTYTFTDPGSGPYADMDALLAVLNDSGNWSSIKPVIATDASSGSDSFVELTLDTSLTAFDAYNERHEYKVIYVGASKGDAAVTQLGFRSSITLASNGLAGGTFTVASLGDLAVGKIIGLDDDNSSPLFPLTVTAVTGSGPYTIEVNDGGTSLTDYTTAQNAVVFDSYSSIDPDTLEVTDGPSGYVRGYRGNRIVNTRKGTDTEIITENTNDIIFRIRYVGASGSAATMTIQDVASVKKLTTSVTSDSASNLDITLSDYPTITQLVDYINNFNSGAYTCVTDYYNADSASPGDLDYYNAIDIKTWPLEVKSAIVEIETNVNTESQFLTFDQQSNVYGQLATVSSDARTYLTGAVLGASTNTNFQSGFDALLTTRCNIVVPLVSQDASADITDGNTDADSTYTIDSILSMADAHCRTASNTQNRSERNTILGFKGAFEDCIAIAKTINSEYASLAIQDVRVRDSAGDAYWADPWMFAVIAAGCQAGSDIGTALTYKYINAIGVDHEDFDPVTQFNAALRAGILFAQQPDAGGIRIAAGNTTYLKDNNPVFNRMALMEICNYIVYDTRVQLEAAFVGKSRASGTSLVVAIETFLEGIFNNYRRNNLLAGDAANEGLGYRNLSVSIDGLVVSYSVVITPAPEVNFILGDFLVAQVRDTVS